MLQAFKAQASKLGVPSSVLSFLQKVAGDEPGGDGDTLIETNQAGQQGDL